MSKEDKTKLNYLIIDNQFYTLEFPDETQLTVDSVIHFLQTTPVILSRSLNKHSDYFYNVSNGLSSPSLIIDGLLK